MKIERIIPYLMDGLAALVGGIGTTAGLLSLAVVLGDLSNAKLIIALFLLSAICGAFLAVRIARMSIRHQVHMELAEGGK